MLVFPGINSTFRSCEVLCVSCTDCFSSLATRSRPKSGPIRNSIWTRRERLRKTNSSCRPGTLRRSVALRSFLTLKKVCFISAKFDVILTFVSFVRLEKRANRLLNQQRLKCLDLTMRTVYFHRSDKDRQGNGFVKPIPNYSQPIKPTLIFQRFAACRVTTSASACLCSNLSPTLSRCRFPLPGNTS